MNNPVIGVTVSQKNLQWERSNYIPTDYTKAILAAGGIPQLIPLEYPLDRLIELRAECAGILLTGGEDIEPGLYHRLTHCSIQTTCAERDATEYTLTRLAAETGWPILGICRGHQMLNVALGGTLYTHIPAQFKTDIDHQASEYNDHQFLAHTVIIEKNTSLNAILHTESLKVNTRHHQAVKDLAENLRVTARATDGLIEGIELPGHPFFLGVQWHPECLQDIESHKQIFTSFIAAAREFSAGG
ncbi:MAG TPA: gamma-glutamyl-gamma-aminobutyrate hydrolase family protein [Anaerolineaceae bacterium]|nr:gamma-glutamyl-gamma-aminobutyrate hydrolase family protein [Anaerolineaceae bacterium]HOM68112.1 gamma-glutamyl-gamma-aminobutyrate hydrolase family protein [Brevefilum fermentans]HOQ69981.1 gamma-glutamyl-gamma-aminobutyrate hydrolase family protein [Anaerolineaceae bacterium]HQK05098.1 gamma-glutamyl-gamma-aminobutyrate hydrolase family protein [Anaerolineaceae bacterium]